MKRTLQTQIKAGYAKQPFETGCLLAFFLVVVVSAITGVYYPEEVFTIQALSALCMLVCLLFSKEKNITLSNSLLEYLILAFILLYVISIAWAVNTQWAFEKALNYINYFLLYLLAARVMHERHTHSIMKAFVIIGSLLALAGIGNYLGLLPLEGGVQAGRITVTLKYTNALGSYLLACIVLAHYGISEWKLRSLYKLGFYLMVVAFIGTFSRANYLIAVPVIIGLYIAFPGEKRKLIVESMLLLICGITASLVIFSTVGIYLKLLVLCLGFLASGLGGKKKAALIGILILLTIALLMIPNNNNPAEAAANSQPVETKGTADSVTDSRVVTRIQEIDTEESNLQARLVFYQDAVELIKESPVLGKGGGAWRTLYLLHRSFLYYSANPHSYPLEVGTEIGLTGMILLLLMLIGIFVNTIWCAKKENRVLGFALAAIFLHSFVDFDLTIGFLAITAWVLLGLFQNKPLEKKNKGLNINKWVLVVFCGVFLMVSSLLLVSTYSADLGEEAAYDTANSRLSRAISLYPINSVNYGTLANVNYKAFQLSGSQKYLDLAISQIDHAVRLSPLNYNWYLDKAFYHTERGEWDKAVAVIKDNIDLVPKFHNDSYAKAAYYLRMAAMGYLESNEQAKGREALEVTVALWQKAQEEMAFVPQKYYSLWREEETVTEYDPFLLEVINAYDFLGEKEKAGALISRLSEKTLEENEWLKDV